MPNTSNFRKKLISYSIFGQDSFYRRSFTNNLSHVRRLFPDYQIRVYVDSKLPESFIALLEREQLDVRVMLSHYAYHGLLWRFLPIEEQNIFCLVKDVDNRPDKREVWVADDFSQSEKRYYTQRDTPGSRSQIMAGAFGFKTDRNTIAIEHKWNRWRKRYRFSDDDYLWDQGFLGEMIYPLIRTQLIVYTEHVIYEGESTIRRVPIPKKFCADSIDSLLPYRAEDVAEDNTARNHYHGDYSITSNEGRKKLNEDTRVFFQKHLHADKNLPEPNTWKLNLIYSVSNDMNYFYNGLSVYYPRHRVSNRFLNELLFLIHLFLKYYEADPLVTFYVRYRLKHFLFFRLKIKIRSFETVKLTHEEERGFFPYR